MNAATFVIAGRLDQRTGGYIYDARIIAALRAAGWRVDVHELAGRFPGPDATAAQSLAATLGALPDDRCVIVDALACGALPDVIERHAARLRLIVVVHHPLADETGLDAYRAAELLAGERRTLACAASVVVTSAFTRTRLRELGLAARATAVIEPGVAPRPLARPHPQAPCRLLCVATLVPRKGHPVLIEALARLAARDWRCDLVGDDRRDPEHAARVRAAIADAGLAARVHVHGTLNNGALDACYGRADLFVLASHYEGYGMVITEALAAGLPIVTTTGGALGATLPAGAGIAVAPGDAVALARAIGRMLDDPGARARAAQAARDARTRLPDWQAAGIAFARVLEATAGCA